MSIFNNLIVRFGASFTSRDAVPSSLPAYPEPVAGCAFLV